MESADTLTDSIAIDALEISYYHDGGREGDERREDRELEDCPAQGVRHGDQVIRGSLFASFLVKAAYRRLIARTIRKQANLE
jgi:hypothetical protein